MKKLLILLAVSATIFSAAYFFQQEITNGARQLIFFSYCDNPIRYRIGNVDPRFNITINQLKLDTQEATQIWNEIGKKQLFVFDPEAKLTINMAYDERQHLKKQINQQDTSLNQEKEDIEPQISQYDALVKSFRKEADSLDAQIQNWNSQGGAPPDVYDQLVTKRRELQERSQQLQQMARTLKRSTDEYNQEVTKLNQTIHTFNDTLDVKPEEGLYDATNQRIDIYFNTNKTELITTLTHEFGHALGLEHDNDTKSIMYPKVTNTLKPSASDIAAVHEQCKERNRLEEWREKLY